MNVIRITDLNSADLDIYLKLNENRVKRYLEPDPGFFICESIRVIKRAIDRGYEPVSFFVDECRVDEMADIIKDEEVPVYTAPTEVMKEITGYSLTGGVLSAMRRKPHQKMQDFLRSKSRVAVLDDIENPTNVGAIIRSAVALGADGIILTHGSADPLYRRASRVSVGTVFMTDWTFCDSDVINELRQAGFTSYAMALSERACDLGSQMDPGSAKKAVILGNEDHGISEKILSDCDCIVKIPMKEGVDSLNVAAASAVAFWEIFKE